MPSGVWHWQRLVYNHWDTHHWRWQQVTAWSASRTGRLSLTLRLVAPPTIIRIGHVYCRQRFRGRSLSRFLLAARDLYVVVACLPSLIPCRQSHHRRCCYYKRHGDRDGGSCRRQLLICGRWASHTRPLIRHRPNHSCHVSSIVGTITARTPSVINTSGSAGVVGESLLIVIDVWRHSGESIIDAGV